jgi:hypothetical protein
MFLNTVDRNRQLNIGGWQIDVVNMLIVVGLYAIPTWLWCQAHYHQTYYYSTILGVDLFSNKMPYAIWQLSFSFICLGALAIKNWQTRDWLNRYWGIGLMVLSFGMVMSGPLMTLGILMMQQAHSTLRKIQNTPHQSD